MIKTIDFHKIVDFKGLKITLASPDDLRKWSFGEVTKPETINYRTLKPEKDGLFCEKIFGPSKDWECYCGKYKRIRYKGIICDKCGVEVTQSKVRRERMGHIELACPVAHIWYFHNNPSKISLLLNVSAKDLESVLYFAEHIVVDVNDEKKTKTMEALEVLYNKELERLEKEKNQEIKAEEQEESEQIEAFKSKVSSKEEVSLGVEEIKLKTRAKIIEVCEKNAENVDHIKKIHLKLVELVKAIKKNFILTEDEYQKLKEYEAGSFFKVSMGAEAIHKLLSEINISELAASLREQMATATGQKYLKITKRLRLVEGMKKASIRPEWMVWTVLPVLPPDLRPMVQLSGGRFASSDLNDLYRRVINRNNRLKQLLGLGAPDIILRNEKRMLQEAVDSLIDETSRVKSRKTNVKKVLRSLSEMLRGKQGRFRQNLLGKRVDYSGRSVIVVGPQLKLNQCGLPKEMALEMFKPFVLRNLIVKGFAPNVKSAKHLLDRKTDEVWDILEEITKNHPVLLNRAPTLHKLGIQAFYPILIEGKAIQIHPCVCAGFNADFDGDQMAVHIPLSMDARRESRDLIMSTHNLLKPSDGSPVTIPNKEMVLGCYYLTTIINNEDGKTPEKLKSFSSFEEAIYFEQIGKVGKRELIEVVDKKGELIKTSVGRILFNEKLPEELQFFNDEVKAATIKTMISKALQMFSNEEVSKLIDNIKDIGFWGSTISGGLSVSVFDCVTIKEKDVLIKEAENLVGEIDSNFKEGLITREEERRLSNEIWISTTEKIADLTWENLKIENPVKMVINSGGARASKDQLKQLSAMRGLVVDPLGKIVPMPTKSNFRQGLSIFEYVTSSRGSRKGLTDSALKTADAGYLTRRLIDVSHDMIVRTEDCGTEAGIEITKHDKRQTSFYQRILGRVTLVDVVNKKTKEVVLKKGDIITEELLPQVKACEIDKIFVRSPLTCEAKYGLCMKCYGYDFSTKKMTVIGTPAGIIAAQSIGEPGTQLTMRVRHAGGIVGLDVTQGLPRAEELFEARIPKNLTSIVEISGKVSIKEEGDNYLIKVKSVGAAVHEERDYVLPKSVALKIKDKDLVEAGSAMAEGFLNIQEVLETSGLLGAQRYLIDELQAVYENQGIPINDKHFEVVVRKMSDKIKVLSPGDTTILPGEYLEKNKFNEENAKILASGGEPATAKVVILGISKSAVFTYSWLSAASFEQTTSVLTEAAVQGKEDMLIGLKENVIIGRLIPIDEKRARLE
jgi:DNA-directed RNA polymerase subunit beta'